MIFKNFNDFLILWLLFSHDILVLLSGCKIISLLVEDINEGFSEVLNLLRHLCFPSGHFFP